MPFRHIVCPVDFSGHSDKALELATELAKQSRSKLTLLHVYAIPVLPLPEGQVMYTSEQLADVRGKLDEAMARTRAQVEAAGLTSIDTALLDGAPAELIVEEARQRGADLIVMATHGRTGLAHVLIGSVAERVVRSAPCPVLTVRSPEPHK